MGVVVDKDWGGGGKEEEESSQQQRSGSCWDALHADATPAIWW